MDEPKDHRFETRLLKSHQECVAGAALCLLLAWRQKRLREIAFPLALLATAAAIHSVHRPWWNYYYLHFAVPLAWLTGWAVDTLIQHILKLRSLPRMSFNTGATWKMLALCTVVALALARAERRLESGVSELRKQPSAESNPIVKAMKRYAGRTKWVYSESGIYAFHAQVPVLPELAIIMPKRFWSGQITTSEIVAYCKRHQAEMIVLPLTSHNADWQGLLAESYIPLTRDAKCILYLSKQIKTEPRVQAGD